MVAGYGERNCSSVGAQLFGDEWSSPVTTFGTRSVLLLFLPTLIGPSASRISSLINRFVGDDDGIQDYPPVVSIRGKS